jgi:hypothetical protein
MWILWIIIGFFALLALILMCFAILATGDPVETSIDTDRDLPPTFSFLLEDVDVGSLDSFQTYVNEKLVQSTLYADIALYPSYETHTENPLYHDGGIYDNALALMYLTATSQGARAEQMLDSILGLARNRGYLVQQNASVDRVASYIGLHNSYSVQTDAGKPNDSVPVPKANLFLTLALANFIIDNTFAHTGTRTRDALRLMYDTVIFFSVETFAQQDLEDVTLMYAASVALSHKLIGLFGDFEMRVNISTIETFRDDAKEIIDSSYVEDAEDSGYYHSLSQRSGRTISTREQSWVTLAAANDHENNSLSWMVENCYVTDSTRLPKGCYDTQDCKIESADNIYMGFAYSNTGLGINVEATGACLMALLSSTIFTGSFTREETRQYLSSSLSSLVKLKDRRKDGGIIATFRTEPESGEPADNNRGSEDLGGEFRFVSAAATFWTALTINYIQSGGNRRFNIFVI